MKTDENRDEAREDLDLSEILAAIYPTMPSARNIAVRAQLDQTHIDFSGAARDYWRNIIELARKVPGAREKIVEQALVEAPAYKNKLETALEKDLEIDPAKSSHESTPPSSEKVTIIEMLQNEIHALKAENEQNQLDIEEILHDAGLALANRDSLYGFWLHKVTHDVRDGWEMICCKAFNGTLNLDFLQNDSQHRTRQICTYVEQLFTNICGQQMSVCIKVITRDPNGREFAETLGRSQNSNLDRLHLDVNPVTARQPIDDNTAFFEIRHHGRRFHGSNDLMKLSREGHYRNSNPMWPNFFKSAIVVPIRAQNFRNPTATGRVYILRGFLCIDAKEVGAFGDDENLERHAQCMLTVADSYYLYLDIVRFFSRQL